MKILAIESSCDETAAGVIEDGVGIISSVIASSAQLNQKYGGVVPEVAAREQLRCILPVINEALAPYCDKETGFNRQTIEKNIDAIAVTIGPGLIGSLLIGVETAKSIAYVTGLPLVPVNHVLAHMYANFVNTGDVTPDILFPAVSLVASGGHTELYLMESLKNLTWLGGTVDDAAGEAFDKTARLLGFGAGGGAAIQNAAKQFNAGQTSYNVKLPRPMLQDENLNFSFSGLKTAIIREWRKYDSHTDALINAFAFEVQEAITDVLVTKTLRAADRNDAKSILLSGGVSANLRLREKFKTVLESQNSNLGFFVPPVQLCTDNAVYIGSYAYFRGKPVNWKTLVAQPDLSVEKI